MSRLERATAFVSRPIIRNLWTWVVILFFLAFVMTPTLFVLTYAFTNWGLIQSDVIQDPEIMSQIWTAIANSFEIAAIVTIVDILVGLPMAWILVRKMFKGKELLDTLIDMPLAVPTAALGFSAAIFWGITPADLTNPLGLKIVSSPFILILLLHIIFTYPYMVRSLSAILEQIDQTYETAGQTLGASKLTAVRTITLPLFRAGLVTGIILCFARSLSETGGTVAALATIGNVDFNTAPTLIDSLQSTPALAFTSIVLIILALILLVVVAIIVKRVHIPFRKVWPRPEKILSRGLGPRFKDATSVLFLVFMVLIPSFFVFTFVFTSEPSTSTDWSTFGQSLVNSFLIAGVVTVIDLALGIPLALYIAKNRSKWLPETLDVLVNVPLIVPTVALGFSLKLFWTGGTPVTGPFAIFLVMLAHIAFTYPLMVRNVTGAVEEVDSTYEETARTLGAKPIQSFRRVLFPMIKASILAGAVMAFTRSLGETGATRAVSTTVLTAPNYIVNLIKVNQDYYAAALACIILIIISYAIMLSLRYLTKRKRGVS
jgi:ABC-type sulfate transport system permease component